MTKEAFTPALVQPNSGVFAWLVQFIQSGVDETTRPRPPVKNRSRSASSWTSVQFVYGVEAKRTNQPRDCVTVISTWIYKLNYYWIHLLDVNCQGSNLRICFRKLFVNHGNTYMHQHMRPGIFPNQSESEKELQQRCVVYFGSFWLRIHTDIIPKVKDACSFFRKWGWIAVSTDNSNNQLIIAQKINILIRRR